MRDLWEQFKRFCNGQERIDGMNREFDQRMEWHREDIERAREQARAELRDRFAMAALTGLLSYETAVLRGTPEGFAEHAYQFADAMLQARGDE